MSIAALPNKRAYVQAWRIAKIAPPDARLLWNRDAWEVVTPAEALRRFRKALDRRINTRGGHSDWNEPIPDGLVRDVRRVADRLQQRVRFYQFETPRLARRCGHLLSTHED